MTALTARVEGWRQAGALETVRDRAIHVHRREGDGPLLLLLHGFPSSGYDFRLVLDLLAGARTLSFDCLGFGLSDKPRDHVYSLSWQADAAEELVSRAGSPPVFVVAHDMGTSVATELFARDLRGELGIDIAGALLFNGSILLDRASPTIGQRLLRGPLGPAFARLSTRTGFRAQFSRVFSDGHPLSAQEAEDQWALFAHNGGHRIAHRLIHYMDERERLTERWHGAFRDWPGELSLAWGMLDPVATPAVLDGLRDLRPGVPVTELDDVAHYPQLERPELIAAAIAGAVG